MEADAECSSQDGFGSTSLCSGASFLRTAGVRPTLNAIFIFCLLCDSKNFSSDFFWLDKTGTDVNLS